MEDLIIKQAPRSLQMDVARLIMTEKNLEAQRKIGAGRTSQSKGTKFKKNTNGYQGGSGENMQSSQEVAKEGETGNGGVFGVGRSPKNGEMNNWMFDGTQQNGTTQSQENNNAMMST